MHRIKAEILSEVRALFSANKQKDGSKVSYSERFQMKSSNDPRNTLKAKGIFLPIKTRRELINLEIELSKSSTLFNDLVRIFHLDCENYT